jgi:hypothetical protein
MSCKIGQYVGKIDIGDVVYIEAMGQKITDDQCYGYLIYDLDGKWGRARFVDDTEADVHPLDKEYDFSVSISQPHLYHLHPNRKVIP